MEKPQTRNRRVDYEGAWAMRRSGLDCEGSDKVFVDEKSPRYNLFKIAAKASRVLVVCNRIVNKLGINLSI